MSELLMHPMGGGTGSDDLTATAANVLSGKTAVTSDSDDEAIEGTMANNGAMDVTLTPAGNGTTSKEVAEGYYSGGTITADGAAAYSAGHSQGVTDADNRVNTSSASYNSGYANGVTNGKSVNAIGGCLAMAWWNNAISNSNPSSHVSWVDDTTRTLPPGTYIWAVGQESTYGNNDGCWIEVNGSRIAYVNTKDNDSQSQCGSYTLTSSANVRCRAGNYNGRGFAAFVRIG